MKEWGVTSSDERPEGVQITELKVFTNSDIQEVSVEQEDGSYKREYHFVQTEYDKDEYINLLTEQVQEMQDGLVEVVDLILG